MDSTATPDAKRLPWRTITLIAIAAVVFSRNANAFLHPILFGEDGTRLFMYYQENRGLDSLFREYAGYVSFAANLMGWLIGTAPLVAQPYLLALNAGLVGVLCFWVFSSPRFAPVLADLRLRCVACFGMALLPVGNFALMTCTMFVNWHLLFAAALLALATPPRTALGRVTEGGFVWVCLWTNPVSMCLLPIYAWRSYRAALPADRRLYGVLAALTILYPLLFVGGATSTNGSFPPSLAGTLSDTASLLTERVVTEPLIGTNGRFHLSRSHLPFAMLWPAVVVALFFWWRRSVLAPDARRRLLAMGGLILAMTVMVTFARHDQIAGMQQWGHRYTYVQKLLLYLALLVAAFTSCGRPAWLCVIVITHATILGWFGSRPYDTSPRRGDRLMAFVHAAAAWQTDPHATGHEMIHTEPTRKIVIRRRPMTPGSPR